MHLNNYVVYIPEGRETENGYVLMVHNSKYKLMLKNSNRTRCNAEVEIDGKIIGTWRIEAQDVITLERPPHDTGCFTFYKTNSVEGDRVGLDASNPSTGLIKVTFTPERIVRHWEDRSYNDTLETFGTRGVASKGLGAGGTGLSGSSQQQFKRAREIELDHSKATTIHLRLVADNKEEPRPLMSYSSPVPPPIM